MNTPPKLTTNDITQNQSNLLFNFNTTSKTTSSNFNTTSNSSFGRLIPIGGGSGGSFDKAYCPQHSTSSSQSIQPIECRKSIWPTGIQFTFCETTPESPSTPAPKLQQLFKTRWSDRSSRSSALKKMPGIGRNTSAETLSPINHVNNGKIKEATFCKATPLPSHDLIQPLQLPFTSPSQYPQFRLLCDRTSGQVKVYAGKVSIHSTIHLSSDCIKWYRPDGSVDGFVKHPLLLWHPTSQKWTEISVLGFGYEPQTSATSKSGTQVEVSTFTNTLTDGCLIYSAGTTFLWKGGEKVQGFEKQLLDYLSRLTCPVTLDYIPCAFVSEPIGKCTCNTSHWLTWKTLTWKTLSNILLKKVHRRNLIEKYKQRPWFFSSCGYITHHQLHNLTIDTSTLTIKITQVTVYVQHAEKKDFSVPSKSTQLLNS